MVSLLELRTVLGVVGRGPRPRVPPRSSNAVTTAGTAWAGLAHAASSGITSAQRPSQSRTAMVAADDRVVGEVVGDLPGGGAEVVETLGAPVEPAGHRQPRDLGAVQDGLAVPDAQPAAASSRASRTAASNSRPGGPARCSATACRQAETRCARSSPSRAARAIDSVVHANRSGAVRATHRDTQATWQASTTSMSSPSRRAMANASSTSARRSTNDVRWCSLVGQGEQDPARSGESSSGSPTRLVRRAVTTVSFTSPSGAERHSVPNVGAIAAPATAAGSPISRATATACSTVATSCGSSAAQR